MKGVSSRKERWIGLLDANNFFVSCERLFRPDLRTKPTVVLSGNDGCIVARSKEIKEPGIPMGVPYFKAKTELEAAGAAVFSSNFPLYRDISSRVMSVLREEMPEVEQYSVDEAFFGITSDENEVLGVLERLKQAVETQVGVPVSVGAAKTKTIAKEASEIGKKSSGTSLLAGGTWLEHIKTLPVQEIWGIGRQTSQKMREHGIETVANFLAADTARIDQLFGIGGLRLYDELSEKPVFHLGEGGRSEGQKSIMSTRSFAKTTTDKSVLADALSYHVAHVAKELREQYTKAGWLSILIQTSRHSDWLLRGGSEGVSLLVPSNDTRVILKEALALLDRLYETGVPYKKAGVVVGNLVDTNIEQGNLFATTTVNESTELMAAVDTLNQKLGKDTVTIGRLGKQGQWGASKQFSSPAYTTNWRAIQTVHA